MAHYRVNKAGNHRGSNPKSLDGLEKAREVRRKGENRGRANEEEVMQPPTPSVAPISMPKINLRDIERYNTRIQGFLTHLDADPGALIATTIGTLLAEIDAANTALGKMWNWMNVFLDNPTNDPRECIKLMETLRKWTETLQTATLKIAEIQSKTVIQERQDNPLDAYRKASPVAPVIIKVKGETVTEDS